MRAVMKNRKSLNSGLSLICKNFPQITVTVDAGRANNSAGLTSIMPLSQLHRLYKLRIIVIAGAYTRTY